MTQTVGEAYVKVRPDTAGFAGLLSTEVGGASRKAGVVAGKEAGVGFSEGFKSTLKTGALLIGVTAGLSEVTGAVEKAAAHAGEIALLGKAIQDAGAQNILFGDTVENVIRKQALQRGFIDEALYPSFTRLVGATHSTEKAYKDLGLAEDIARQRHIDVTIAALALAKAEQGSATGLQRLGIILPAYAAHLDRAAKSAIVLDIAQKRFTGSAEAFANSGAGALQRFAEARHVIEETAGQALLPQVEKAANATADWTSKSENLARVQHDVAAVGQVVAGSVKAIAFGLHGVSEIAGPVVHALGGIEKTTELAFGALAVRKAQVWGGAIVKATLGAVAGETAAATATTGYTAAVVANTVAVGANVVVVDEATAAFGLNAAAATRGGLILDGAGASAAAASTKFLSFGVSAGGAASVLKSGVAPAAVIAGYELSTFIRKIPGWNSAMESFGSTAEKLAEKLGLVGGAATKVPSFTSGIQARLIAAYREAVKEVPNGSGLGAAEREQIIQRLIGPGYTFHDAQVFANNQANFQRGQGGAGIRQNYNPAAEAAAAKAGRPTDLDYQIQLQRALATKTTADEEELYQTRLAYIAKRVDSLRQDNNLTADQKKNLLRLETEQNSLQSAITAIHTQAAQAAKSAADHAKQARAAADRLRQQRIREEQQDIQQAAQAYRASLSLEEQKIQLQATRAQLTQKSIKDDAAAARALIAFYRKESHDAKLTESERLNYTSQAIQEQIALKALKAPGGAASSAQDVFAEAAKEFRTYGSNITGRSGILSGQDARASFAHGLLGGQLSGADLAVRVAAQQRSAQLTEAQKQTALLTSIDRRLGGTDAKNRPPAHATRNARRTAAIIGG